LKGLNMKDMMIHISMDDEAEMAYITLLPRWIGDGEIDRTLTCEGEGVNLDYDKNGKLIGIEILSTSVLHPEMLESFEPTTL